MKLYISPSNQPANKYAVGGTNEKAQMEALAKLVQERLRGYEIDTVMATLSYDINQRDDEAKAKGCTHYLALHSNAGGAGKAQGAVAFYHPKASVTKTLATNLVNELNAINPYKESRNAQVVDGMTLFDGAGAGEIREPYKKGLKPVLLEVDFHDNPTTARWIIDNKPVIADAIVRALVMTFKLKKMATPEPAPSVGVKEMTGTVKVIYTGADGVNARKMPDFSTGSVDHVVKAGDVFTVTGITTDGQFYHLKSGLYITTGDKYVEYSAATPAVPAFTEYLVKVTAYALNVRKGPGINHPIATTIRLGQVYTIVGEKDGWGQLKSGAGWINLDYTARVYQLVTGSKRVEFFGDIWTRTL